MGDRRTDILVIGGGPVGSCTALELARAGAEVTLIERELDVCPPASAAHANCGLIVPSDIVPLASPGALGQGLRWLRDSSSPFYIAPRPSAALCRWLWLFRRAAAPARAAAAMPVLRALHVESARLHDELAREHGATWLYHANGLLQAYETDAGFAAATAELEETSRFGVRAEVLDAAAVRARFPQLTGQVAGAVFYAEDAHVEPALFTRAVARLAADAGATVLTGVEAFAVEDGSAGARVLTTKGRIEAGQVVIAAGAWSPPLARDAGERLPIEPAKGYSVDLDRPASFPEVPFYLGEAHVLLTPLGDALRLGGTLELSGWDLRVRRNRVRGLRRGAERGFGIREDAPARQTWRGPRPVTPDGLPVVGRAPRRQAVIIAAGHCMLGLSLAPVTGRLVAELAGGGSPSIDLAPLSPRRFALL